MRADLLTLFSRGADAGTLRDHASLKAVAATSIALLTVVAATLAFPEGESGATAIAAENFAAQVAMAPAARPAP
jgi:hypothetical protein